MRYWVRINGEVLGPLERIEIEKRFTKFVESGVSVEVANADQNFAPLADFLTGPTLPIPSPTPLKIPSSGNYKVRVCGVEIGPLSRDDIEKRLVKFLRSVAAAEVADVGDQTFVPLANFLTKSAPSPPSRSVRFRILRMLSVIPSILIQRRKSIRNGQVLSSPRNGSRS